MRRLRHLKAIILVAGGCLCTTSIWPQSFEKSYAVLIAINDYKYPTRWPHLDYPENDAKTFGDFLASQGFIVKTFLGPAATKQNIHSFLTDTLAENLRQGDRVLFFFAGHGHTEMLGGKKRGYIVPYDGLSSSTLISMEELQDESSNLGNARHQLFLLDSCFGGLLERPRDSVVDPKKPHDIEDVSARVARQALTAGGENDMVIDNGPNGHSVFMDALLEALRDGQADFLGNGYITFNEFAAYVVLRASNKFQTPDPGFLPGHQGGEFWFRDLKRTTEAISSIPLPSLAKVRSDTSTLTLEQLIAASTASWFAGDYDLSAEELRAAIQLKPKDVDLHRGLAIALRAKGDWSGAIKVDREAVQLNPNDAHAHANLAEMLGSHGDWDGVIREDREAVRLDPNDVEAHRDLGTAFSMKREWREAIKEEQEAIQLDPDDDTVHNRLGVIYAAMRKWDAAMRQEQEAIRLNPDYATAHDNLGLMLEKKGQYRAALNEYLKAAALDPDDEAYKEHLVRLQKVVAP